MNLTTHFTLDEMTDSPTAVRLGIDNSPSNQVLDKLYDTAAGMERVRSVLGVPIHVSSGYRCPKLNTAVHGAKNSQHTLGEAVDFTAPEFGTPLQVCRALLKDKDFVGFDQLIMEGTWVHISFSDATRGKVMTAHFNGGKVSYTEGLA